MSIRELGFSLVIPGVAAPVQKALLLCLTVFGNDFSSSMNVF